MKVRSVSEAPTLKANFATSVSLLRRSASLPDILTKFMSEYFNLEKQDSSFRLIDATIVGQDHLRCRPTIMAEMEATQSLVPSGGKTRQFL